MANFALLKESIVIAVIVIDNEVITNNGIEVEQLGIDFSRDFYIPTLTTNKKGSMSAFILHKEANKEVTLDYHFGDDYVEVTCYI